MTAMHLWNFTFMSTQFCFGKDWTQNWTLKTCWLKVFCLGSWIQSQNIGKLNACKGCCRIAKNALSVIITTVIICNIGRAMKRKEGKIPKRPKLPKLISADCRYSRSSRTLIRNLTSYEMFGLKVVSLTIGWKRSSFLTGHWALWVSGLWAGRGDDD